MRQHTLKTMRSAWLLITFFLLAFLTGADSSPAQALPATSPPDPTADIPWNTTYNGVLDIQTAFNVARTQENAQLGTHLPMLALPSQVAWDVLSNGEKALWLINAERIDRGVMPLHGVESNVTNVAEYYAQYLLDNGELTVAHHLILNLSHQPLVCLSAGGCLRQPAALPIQVVVMVCSMNISLFKLVNA
jgi:hypothetical protein